MITEMLNSWKMETGKISPGAQRVFLDALQAVADGKIRMSYGADYSESGAPCLVNAVRPMLNISEQVSPSAGFGGIVSMFDQICKNIAKRHLSGHVTEIMAETLVRNFAELKPMPEPVVTTPQVDGINAPYVECSDEELMADFLNATTMPAPQAQNFPLSFVKPFIPADTNDSAGV